MNLDSIQSAVEQGSEAARLNTLSYPEMEKGVNDQRHVLRSLGFGEEEIEEMAEQNQRNFTVLVDNQSESIN